MHFEAINSSGLTVERLRSDDWEMYRAIRLASLQESPESFCTSLEEAESRSEESWKSQVLQLATSSVDSCFIGKLLEEPVGIMSVYQVQPGVSELMQVWVSPRLRGTGIARTLFSTLLDWVRHSETERFLLRVKSYNSRAVEFYRKLGFSFLDQAGSEDRYEFPLTS